MEHFSLTLKKDNIQRRGYIYLKGRCMKFFYSLVYWNTYVGLMHLEAWGKQYIVEKYLTHTR